MVRTECVDPSAEDEFNQWYNQVHIPDLLQNPDVKKAERYEDQSPTPGQGKYLAVYELETDDIDRTMASIRANVAVLREQGRISPLLNVVSRSLCRSLG